MDTELPNYLSNIQEFLGKFDNFLLDCDGMWRYFIGFFNLEGVLWLGNQVIEGIPKTLEMLRSLVRIFLSSQYHSLIDVGKENRIRDE